jgi:hypothetical protein
MSYSSEVLADSPLAYYRLGESSGTVAADSSGNGRDGAYVGAITLGAASLLPTVSNTAMALSANSGQRMAVASAAWMNLTAAISVEAWVDITGWGDPVVNKFDSTSTRSWRLVRAGSDWLFTIWFSDGTSAAITTPAGSGGHLVATWDGSTIALYVNGTLAASAATAAKTLRTGSDAIEVGRYSGQAASVPTAVYDEVAIYDHALSSTRVAAHYTAGTTPGAIGTIVANLPALSANLAGGIEFSGAIAATLPSLAGGLVGETYPPGVAGDIVAVLPSLSADLAGSSVAPVFSGALDATLPALRGTLAGQSFAPGLEGYIEALLPALSASLAGNALGRVGFGLILDSSATVSADAPLEPLPTPTGAPATSLRIVATSVPIPTLVAGRPQ